MTWQQKPQTSQDLSIGRVSYETRVEGKLDITIFKSRRAEPWQLACMPFFCGQRLMAVTPEEAQTEALTTVAAALKATAETLLERAKLKKRPSVAAAAFDR